MGFLLLASSLLWGMFFGSWAAYDAAIDSAFVGMVGTGTLALITTAVLLVRIARWRE